MSRPVCRINPHDYSLRPRQSAIEDHEWHLKGESVAEQDPALIVERYEFEDEALSEICEDMCCLRV